MSSHSNAASKAVCNMTQRTLSQNGWNDADECPTCRMPAYCHTSRVLVDIKKNEMKINKHGTLKRSDKEDIKQNEKENVYHLHECQCTYCGTIVKDASFKSTTNSYSFVCRCIDKNDMTPKRLHKLRHANDENDYDEHGYIKFGCFKLS